MLTVLNYADHPTRIGFVVFRFYQKERSDLFENLLNQEAIFYEFSAEDGGELFLFGIRKGDFKKASKANYLVSANFRKKIIPNFYIRWGVISFCLLLLLLALIGAFFKT